MQYASTESVSLSKMAGLFKEDGITRDQILSFLIEKGFVLDIKTPTEVGLQNGVSLCTNVFNGEEKTYPVYSPEIQDVIRNSLDYIKATYPAADKKSKNSLKEDKSKEKSIVSVPNADYVKKYLGITSDFVILDTETTGLEADDEVIELGIIDSNGKTLLHRYFYPEKEVNPFAQKVNHLNKKKLYELSGRYTISAGYWEEIKAAVAGKIIIGHNIPFDKRMIAQTFKLHGANLDKEVEEMFEGCLDTKVMAKQWITAKSYSLNNLTTDLGIVREELHEAVDDCRMTLEFINRLEDILSIRAGEYDFVKAPEEIIRVEEKEEDIDLDLE